MRWEEGDWEADIDEDGANIPGNYSSNVLSLGEISKCMTIYWDHEETRGPADAQPAIFYFAPLEVLYKKTDSTLCLEGLLLKPALTSTQKGKFERVGMFELEQFASSNIRRRLKDGKEALFYTTDELFPQLSGGSEEERTKLLSSDPYLNGPLNTKLKDRYSHLLEPNENDEVSYAMVCPKLETPPWEEVDDEEVDDDTIPNAVGRFLELLELAAQHNKESNKPDENLQHDKGDGFYIYELV